MGEKQSRKKVLKILSRIDASAFDMQDFAIQVRASSMGELLEDAAKADEAIIYSDNDELARLLWERDWKSRHSRKTTQNRRRVLLPCRVEGDRVKAQQK
jgi:hypothetical protein